MSPQVFPITNSDVPASFEFRDRALTPSQAPISYLFFNRPHTPQDIERETGRLESDPNVLLFKAMEGDTMVACARARKVPHNPSGMEVRLPEWYEGCGVGKLAWDQFWAIRTQARKECFPNADHIYVDLVATDPMYQRRGAGSCLLTKFAAIADESGLPTYLVSTQAGRRLYEKAGFVVIKEFVLDLAEMGETAPGSERRETFTYMIRYPEITAGMEAHNAKSM